MGFWRSRCSGLALEDNIILTHGYHSKAFGIVEVNMGDLMWLCPDTAVLGVNCGLSIRYGHMSCVMNLPRGGDLSRLLEKSCSSQEIKLSIELQILLVISAKHQALLKSRTVVRGRRQTCLFWIRVLPPERQDFVVSASHTRNLEFGGSSLQTRTATKLLIYTANINLRQ